MTSDGATTATPDFDPATVPIRPAATVMVVDDRPDLRVLMLRRTAGAIFAGDMWVYPGGRVDPDDAEFARRHVVGLTAEEADRRLGVQGTGLAYWVAALRECFEEAGILLAREADTGRPLDMTDPHLVARLDDHRRALNAGERSFADIVDDERVVLDAALIHYIAHWVTPPGGPRRFDTRFFLAAAPPGQVAAHDENEVVHHEWVSPAAALALWQADRMAMMTPTARMLMSLRPFPVAAAAVAAAAADQSAEQIRVRRDPDDTYHILLPGDPGWDTGDPETEFGWVKLRPLRGA